jgi:hypothetical protein
MKKLCLLLLAAACLSAQTNPVAQIYVYVRVGGVWTFAPVTIDPSLELDTSTPVGPVLRLNQAFVKSLIPPAAPIREKDVTTQTGGATTPKGVIAIPDAAIYLRVIVGGLELSEAVDYTVAADRKSVTLLKAVPDGMQVKVAYRY